MNDTIFEPSEDQEKTLESFNRKLENIRDNITINDAEVVRLKRLAVSLKYEVQQTTNSRVALTNEIAELKNIKENLQAEIEEKNSQKNSLDKKIKSNNMVIVDQKNLIKNKDEEINDINSNYAKKIASQNEREIFLEDLKLKLSERESKIKEEEQKIIIKKRNMSSAVKEIEKIINNIG
jgi:chromosome segregation ATPase